MKLNGNFAFSNLSFAIPAIGIPIYTELLYHLVIRNGPSGRTKRNKKVSGDVYNLEAVL
jgi:hypothetical protein